MKEARNRLPAALRAVALCLFIFFAFFLVEKNFPLPSAQASLLIERCSDEDRSRCYEREVSALVDQGLSMEKVIAITRRVLEGDPAFQHCHALGHKIAAREVAKDPTRWSAVALGAPTDICSYGFIHGAFQERFKIEYFSPTTTVVAAAAPFVGLCDQDGWQHKTRRERLSCMHALGHLFLYLTRADIHKAANICDEVGVHLDVNMRRSCLEGAFMTLYQQLEPEDVALVEGVAPTSVSERDALCDEFAGVKKSSCMLESFPLDPQTQDPQGIASFCKIIAKKDAQEEAYCANFLSYRALVDMQFAFEPFVAFCTKVPGFEGRCLSFGASVLLEAGRSDFAESLALCRRARDYGAENFCYDLLVESSKTMLGEGSYRALALCYSLPPQWRETCGGGI